VFTLLVDSATLGGLTSRLCPQATFACSGSQTPEDAEEAGGESSDEGEEDDLARLSSHSLPLPLPGVQSRLCFHHPMAFSLVADEWGRTSERARRRHGRLVAAALNSWRGRASLNPPGPGLVVHILVCAEAGSAPGGDKSADEVNGKDSREDDGGGEAWELGAARLELSAALTSPDGAPIPIPLTAQGGEHRVGTVSVRVFAVAALAIAAGGSCAAETGAASVAPEAGGQGAEPADRLPAARASGGAAAATAYGMGSLDCGAADGLDSPRGEDSRDGEPAARADLRGLGPGPADPRYLSAPVFAAAPPRQRSAAPTMTPQESGRGPAQSGRPDSRTVAAASRQAPPVAEAKPAIGRGLQAASGGGDPGHGAARGARSAGRAAPVGERARGRSIAWARTCCANAS
jgi:hypothetical protein